MNNKLLGCVEIKTAKDHVKISTINKFCPSIEAGHMVYAETTVLDMKKTPEEVLDMDEASEDSLTGHNRMVKKYLNLFSGEEHEHAES